MDYDKASDIELLQMVLPCVTPADTDSKEEFEVRLEAQNALMALYCRLKVALQELGTKR